MCLTTIKKRKKGKLGANRQNLLLVWITVSTYI